MLIVQLGLNRLSVSKGKFLGRKESCPVWVVELLFVRFTLLSKRAGFLLRESVEGLIEDRNWLIDNSSAVRIARKKAAAKAKAEGVAIYRDQCERYRDLYGDTQEELQKAQEQLQVAMSENRLLRKAIKIVGE